VPTPAGYADVSIQLQNVATPRPAYITFGIDPSGTDPFTIANSIGGTWAAAGSMFTLIDTEVTMTGVRVSLGTDGGEDVIGQTSTTVAGTRSGVSMPCNVAALVHKVTARGGRRGRGRLFIPWVLNSLDVSESGIILTSRLTTMTTALNVWLNGLATGPGPMCILHGPGKTLPGPPNVVTSLVADKLVGTQRRRLGR
jgi:hypothetical protein